jgi:hypothetical protein
VSNAREVLENEVVENEGVIPSARTDVCFKTSSFSYAPVLLPALRQAVARSLRRHGPNSKGKIFRKRETPGHPLPLDLATPSPGGYPPPAVLTSCTPPSY